MWVQVGWRGPHDSAYPALPSYGVNAANPGHAAPGALAYEKPCSTVWLSPAAYAPPIVSSSLRQVVV